MLLVLYEDSECEGPCLSLVHHKHESHLFLSLSWRKTKQICEKQFWLINSCKWVMHSFIRITLHTACMHNRKPDNNNKPVKLNWACEHSLWHTAVAIKTPQQPWAYYQVKCAQCNRVTYSNWYNFCVWAKSPNPRHLIKFQSMVH